MRRTVQVGAVVLMGLGLSACMTRDPYVTPAAATPSGNWRIDRAIDRITGAPAPSALLMGTASNSAADRPRPVGLQLTCFDGKPLVRFGFEFKIGSDRNSILGYRFDEKPGRDAIDARFLLDGKTVVIEDRTLVAQFASDLAGSGNLVIRIRSLNVGRTTAEFRLDGAAAALEAGFAGCSPLAPAPERLRSRDLVAR